MNETITHVRFIGSIFESDCAAVNANQTIELNIENE